jgi:chromosome segregation ATPase
MDAMKSKEIRNALNQLKAKLRELKHQLEEVTAKQSETMAGSLEFFDLQDARRALEAQLPGLADEGRKLTRELARALIVEADEIAAVSVKARQAIQAPLKNIIEKLEANCREAEAEIVALIKPYLPEGAAAPDVAISLRVYNGAYEYHAFDNALYLLMAPVDAVRRTTKDESEALIESLSGRGRL